MEKKHTFAHVRAVPHNRSLGFELLAESNKQLKMPPWNLHH